jgi:muconolactone delta-isomerase
VPSHVEGLSMVGEARRKILLAGCREDASATRMATDGRHKLIWYPTGNVKQVFDLAEDPDELHDLAGTPAVAEVQARLEAAMVEGAWGVDADWITDGKSRPLRPARPAFPATAAGRGGCRGRYARGLIP